MSLKENQYFSPKRHCVITNNNRAGIHFKVLQVAYAIQLIHIFPLYTKESHRNYSFEGNMREFSQFKTDVFTINLHEH